MLYTGTEAKFLSPDGDTDFFTISAGVLQHRDTLASFLFIIAFGYIMGIATRDGVSVGFTLHKARSQRYPDITITETDCADDLALISNTHETSATGSS